MELGLGHGYTTVEFNKFFNKHVVLEGDAEIIKKFQLENPSCRAEIVKTYFEDYSTSDKYDVIVLGFILEHVKDPVSILNKYKNYLKDNGRMFIAVPNAESLNRRVGYSAGLLDNIMQLSKHDQMLGHRRYYTTHTINQDCISAGLIVDWMEGLYLKPLTTFQMYQLNLTPEIYEALCTVGRDYPELCLGILAEVSNKEKVFIE